MNKSIKKGIGFVIAFLIGCVAAPIVVPPLSAQNMAAGAQRWEYSCIRQGAGHRDQSGIAQMGREGWEAVTFLGTHTCFKRPM